jgi:hypothetical protein
VESVVCATRSSSRRANRRARSSPSREPVAGLGPKTGRATGQHLIGQGPGLSENGLIGALAQCPGRGGDAAARPSDLIVDAPELLVIFVLPPAAERQVRMAADEAGDHAHPAASTCTLARGSGSSALIRRPRRSDHPRPGSGRRSHRRAATAGHPRGAGPLRIPCIPHARPKVIAEGNHSNLPERLELTGCRLPHSDLHFSGA